MSPRLNVVRRVRPADDWDQFRPVRDLRVPPRRRTRQVPLLLVLATILFFVALLAFHFQPEVEGAVAHVAKAVLDLGRPARVIAPTRPGETGSLRSRRKPRRLSPQVRSSGVPALRPFDVYVLDGERYVRVEGMSKYALLDTRTGKIIWIRKPH